MTIELTQKQVNEVLIVNNTEKHHTLHRLDDKIKYYKDKIKSKKVCLLHTHTFNTSIIGQLKDYIVILETLLDDLLYIKNGVVYFNGKIKP